MRLDEVVMNMDAPILRIRSVFPHRKCRRREDWDYMEGQRDHFAQARAR